MTVYVPTRPAGTITPGTNLSPLSLTAHTVAETPLFITGAPGQTANMFAVVTSAGAGGEYVDPNGNVFFGNSWQTFFQSGGGLVIGGNIIMTASSSTISMQPSTGAATLVINSSNSQDIIQFQQANVNKWEFAMNATDPNLYVFDMVNSRFAMTFKPGATAAAATTEIGSNLVVDGTQILVTGTNGYVIVQPTVSSNAFFAASVTNAQAGFLIQNQGVGATWQIYQIVGSDPTLYFRDQVNARMHMSFTPSPTMLSAVTTFSCSVAIQGTSTLGASAPALTATDGFPYIPATPGTPTAAPSAQAGYVAMRYDTTAHKLWIYDAGWKGVVVA